MVERLKGEIILALGSNLGNREDNLSKSISLIGKKIGAVTKISKYFENRDLVLMGGYVQGQDPELDNALALWPEITKFLQQGENEICRFDMSQTQLKELLGA